MTAAKNILRCLVIFAATLVSIKVHAETPTKQADHRSRLYIGTAGGIGRAPYTLVGFRAGWKYGIFTPVELGVGLVGPRVWAFSPPAVFMQAVDIGFGRVEWGLSYHRGLDRRPIVYSRTNESFSDEERSRYGISKCDDQMCRVSPLVLNRKTDYSLLYTHIGLGIQHEIEGRVNAKIAATVGYSYLARAHIGVENEAGDEALGQQRGVLGYPGHFGYTIIGEHDSGPYAQLGIDLLLDP